MMNVLELLKSLTDSEYIINTGGLALLIFVVFAECSFLVGFFLPGNALIFISGIVCYSKPELFTVNLLSLILLLSFGGSFGYFIGYWFGRKKLGPKLLYKKKTYIIFSEKYIGLTTTFYEKHGGKTLIIGRFLPLVRTFAPIIGGMIKMDHKKFMFYNAVGSLIWIAALTSIGYYLGHYEWVQNNINHIIFGLVIITLISIFISYQTKVKKQPLN
jgi:membrane-associated protein